MVDFSNVAAYEPVNEARPYTFLEIEAPVEKPWRIFSKPATETNPDYQNAWLRLQAERQLATARKQQVDNDAIATARDDDRELLAATCVTGWENVTDAKGEPVEFSPENALAFFKALPAWIFDRYRNWVMTPRSFITLPDKQKLGNG